MAGAEQNAEALVKERFGVVGLIVVLELIFQLIGRTHRLPEGKLLIVKIDAGVETIRTPFAVKGALGLHVDRASRGVGVRLGTRGPADLDGLDGRDRKPFEARRARGIAATPVRIGTGRADTVEGDANILRIHPAETRTAGFRLDVINIDAGQVFEKFTDVAIGHVAKNVGRNRGRDVHVAPLVHDRLGISFAFGRHRECGQLQNFPVFRPPRARRGGGADQINFADSRLPRRDREGLVYGDIARVGNRDRSGSGGDTRELKRAIILGIGHLVGAIETDLGVADIFLGDGIVDPALDRAGRSRLGRQRDRQN